MSATNGRAASAEELTGFSVGELKKRLFWLGAAVPSGHLEKADLVEAVLQAQSEGPEAPAIEDGSAEDLTKLSVGDLKKRLFWLGATVPSGHLEKAELVAAVLSAQAARAEKARAAEAERRKQRAREEEANKPREEPRPLNFEKAAASAQDQEIVDLHLLSEADLKKRIDDAGHELPDGDLSKHFLVILCRAAMRDPKPPGERPAKKKEAPAKPVPKPDGDSDEDPGTAVAEYRRPTIGDMVQVVESDLTKRYLPFAVGRVYKIRKDDGGSTPYKLHGLEDRHWFSEKDVKWPDKAKKKKPKHKIIEQDPDDINQPKQIMIMLQRYGCKEGELRHVTGQTADGQSWVCKGGRQVPKSHEGTGWARVEVPESEQSNPTPPPQPPPPSSPQRTESPQQPPAAVPATTATAASAPSKTVTAPPAADDDARDPGELSAAELKRRLRLYSGDLLRGLTEKSELVAALREAMRTQGWPPRRRTREVEVEEEMIAQMEEMQAQLDAGKPIVTALPAAPLAPAVSAAPTASVPAATRPSPAVRDPAAPVRERKRGAAAATAAPAQVSARKRHRPAPTAVLLSVDDAEDDDEVCAVVAPVAVLEEDDDDEVMALGPAKSALQPASLDLDDDEVSVVANEAAIPRAAVSAATASVAGVVSASPPAAATDAGKMWV